MIFFIVQRYHEYTVANFLESWARQLMNRVAILTWEDCARLGRLHRGTYILSDYERLSQPQWDLAHHLSRSLLGAGCRVLNRPERVADRLSLLNKLHATGQNDFRAFRADEDLSKVRFPCFVRQVSTHMGKMSGLIQSHDELNAEIARCKAAGEDDLIVIEYVDTTSPPGAADGGGIYRKFGVTRCVNHYIPRHIYFSKKWLQSASDLVDEWTIAEESNFVDQNPHGEQLKSVFEAGGIDYGRIDYGVLPDGRAQVWEINTNPMLLAEPLRFDPRRLPAQARAAKRTMDAIQEQDDGMAFEPGRRENWIRMDLPATLRAQLGVGRGEDALRFLGRALKRLGRTPGVREFVRICQRAQTLANDQPQRPNRAA